MNVHKESLGARSGFAICVCCKQDVALFDVCWTEGNAAAHYDLPPPLSTKVNMYSCF